MPVSTQLAVALLSAGGGAFSAIAVAALTGYFTRVGKQDDRAAAHESTLVTAENALRGDLLRRLQALEDRDRASVDRIDQLRDTVRGLKDDLSAAQHAVRALTAELAAARERIAALMTELAQLRGRPQES